MPHLVCDNAHDQEFYSKISTSDAKVAVCTVASTPTKPNEDAFVVTGETKLFAAVFDGTTSLKPIVALGDETGARFASHMLRDQFRTPDETIPPHALMIDLNEQLLNTSLNMGADLEDTHTLPSSTGTIIKIDFKNKKLELAHVGDSYCILFYKDGHSELISDDKNRVFDEEMFTLIDSVAKNNKITFRKARDYPEINKALVEMFVRRNNNPNGSGSGLINGEEQMEKYVQSLSKSLENITDILLGTDGLTPVGWLLEDSKDRSKLLQEIKSGGFEKLIQTKHKNENDDKDWDFHRYKHSDDATGVLITLR